MKPRRRSSVMYLIAALCFLIAGVVGFVGDAGVDAANAAFIVLGVAFVVLALNIRRSEQGSNDSQRTTGGQ